ncbi:MAG: hypothetical protein H0T51_22550 [Pirellulales bacterium]|nr:hypothetical protein [Pirellulales bacterium]
MTFANNLYFGNGTNVSLEIGGVTAGTQYDRLTIVGNASLSGTLEVSLIGGFNPAAGHTFALLDWGTRSGTFSSLQLPALAAGLAWDTSLLYSTGVLKVVTPGLFAADFDEDGDVDGNDLVRWRTHFGAGTTHMQGNSDGDADVDGADFLTWQRQLGSATTFASSTAAPEPVTALMLAVAAAGMIVHRRS